MFHHLPFLIPHYLIFLPCKQTKHFKSLKSSIFYFYIHLVTFEVTEDCCPRFICAYTKSLVTQHKNIHNLNTTEIPTIMLRKEKSDMVLKVLLKKFQASTFNSNRTPVVQIAASFSLVQLNKITVPRRTPGGVMCATKGSN